MHELSLARSVLDIVQQNVPADELPNVRAVSMKVGQLAGVIPESLEFCFQSLVAGTPLGSSSLRIERIPFRIHCRQCDQISMSEGGFGLCPLCGSPETTILSGNELQVAEIELEDKVEEAV